MLKLISIFLLLSSFSGQAASCGDSKYENSKLAWHKLGHIDFSTNLALPIPGGYFCMGLDKKKLLKQISYKGSEGSLRVYNRKFFLNKKRQVIESDDFLTSSFIKKSVPILSFFLKPANKNQYVLEFEFVEQFNPIVPSSRPYQFKKIAMHLNTNKPGLYLTAFNDKKLSRIHLEINHLFRIVSVKFFDGAKKIAALKVRDL